MLRTHDSFTKKEETILSRYSPYADQRDFARPYTQGSREIRPGRRAPMILTLSRSSRRCAFSARPKLRALMRRQAAIITKLVATMIRQSTAVPMISRSSRSVFACAARFEIVMPAKTQSDASKTDIPPVMSRTPRLRFFMFHFSKWFLVSWLIHTEPILLDAVRIMFSLLCC